jgi:hypothetical protein
MDDREGQEGRGPTLKHSLAEDLKFFNLRLGDQTEQKGGEKRDKSGGRRVRSPQEGQPKQEVDSMEETMHQKTVTHEPGVSPMTGEGPVDAMLQATTHVARELSHLRQDFERQTSWKADGIRLGAFVLGATAAVVAGSLISHAIINRGEPELPAGPAKK